MAEVTRCDRCNVVAVDGVIHHLRSCPLSKWTLKQGARYSMNKTRLKTGFADTVKYKVLEISGLNKIDRLKVAQQIVLIATGKDASELPVREGWGYKVLDMHGRVGVLTFRGMEVAVFYKRQTMDIIPEDTDPVPEAVLEDPADAWMRLDLTGSSARRASDRVSKTHSEIGKTLEVLKDRVDAQDMAITQYEKENKRLTQQLATAQEMATKKRVDPGVHRASGQKDVLVEMLQIATAFEHGKAHSSPADVKLFDMLSRMLRKSYEKFNGELLIPETGTQFDPTVHEAVQVDPRQSENEIASFSGLGLKVDGKLVEPAKVSVGERKD
jgi:molecular chaperone GrpE (heat shock protein)